MGNEQLCETRRETGVVARAARMRVGYSVEAAATSLGISAGLLRGIEEDENQIASGLVRRLESLYGVSFGAMSTELDQFQTRVPMQYNAATKSLRVGSSTVDFDAGEEGDDVLLQRYAIAVRAQRSDPLDAPVHVRASDMPALACLLHLDDIDLADKMSFWLGLGTAESSLTIAAMRTAKSAGFQTSDGTLFH